MKSDRVRRAFPAIEMTNVQIDDLDHARVGDRVSARVDVRLGDLDPGDVVVELVIARTGEAGRFEEIHATALAPLAPCAHGCSTFGGAWQIDRAGTFAYGVRVRPDPGLGDRDDPIEPVIWA